MIKFRAWIETGNETDDYVEPMTIQQMIHSKESTFSLEQLNDLVDFEQFTGLKDANGKDIYEGDLVRLADDLDNPYKVIFNEAKFEFSGSKFCYDLSEAFMDCEVIGNVHENSELLEDKPMTKPDSEADGQIELVKGEE
ncbi:YopX family protein [Pediococcus ethanolidurans]|uniref:YopX family protein n=1 Tax=Pediococcus ethanolidurans TaxID=319653 RepID=UPI0021E89767|nr:YopX family protein [Pediococcus ethanolidurans]MCV3315427.1 YopX family protein [Pediococcus ethanolidurans]